MTYKILKNHVQKFCAMKDGNMIFQSMYERDAATLHVVCVTLLFTKDYPLQYEPPATFIKSTFFEVSV